MSDFLWPHGLQHARLLHPSLSSGVCSNSCPLSWWCHPTISSSVSPFSSCSQPVPASGSFPMSQLFASGSQNIRVSASVLPTNIQGWLPLGVIGLISLQSKGLSRVFSSNINLKGSILQCSASFMVQLLHRYMTIGKSIALTIRTFADKVMSLVFNMMSSFVTAFLPWCTCLNFAAGVTVYRILEPKENKICHCFHFSPQLFAMKWWCWFPWS